MLSHFETSIFRIFVISALLGIVSVLSFSFESFADVESQDESLRDSCGAYFHGVRTADTQLRLLESHSTPMVRLGGSPDIALYDRLYKVHLAKIAGARAKLRQQESALSGCLANALRDRASSHVQLKETRNLPAPDGYNSVQRFPASNTDANNSGSQGVPLPADGAPARGAPTVR
jgi:hypothetical protein